MRKPIDSAKDGLCIVYRVVTEYIEENIVRWEKEKKERDKERQVTLDEWDKKKRFEKIEYLRKRREEKHLEKRKETPTKESIWNVWRTREQNSEKNPAIQPEKRQEILEHGEQQAKVTTSTTKMNNKIIRTTNTKITKYFKNNHEVQNIVQEKTVKTTRINKKPAKRKKDPVENSSNAATTSMQKVMRTFLNVNSCKKDKSADCSLKTLNRDGSTDHVQDSGVAGFPGFPYYNISRSPLRGSSNRKVKTLVIARLDRM